MLRPVLRRISLLVALSVVAAIAPASGTRASAQGSWAARRVSTTAEFFDVSLPTASHGWIAGSGGTILATSDGGATWRNQTSGTSAKLLAVDFISATTGWAAGQGDTVLSTNDGGTTWTRSSTGSLASLEDIDFVDADHGWAVGFSIAGGQAILATSDGGRTWQRQLTLPDGIGLVDVSFFDRRRGLAVGYLSRVYRTDDAGRTWLPVPFPSEPFDSFYAAAWLDANNAVLGGLNGQIWKSQDRGETWTQKADLDGAVRALVASGDSAFAVGSMGLVARSSDAGTTWATDASGTTADLYGVSAPSPALAVGAGAFGFTTTFTGRPDGSHPAPTPIDLGRGTDSCSPELATTWTHEAAGLKVASVVHDFDGDGTAEIVVGGPEGIRALRPFVPTAQATVWQLPLPAFVQDLATAQLDTDGDRELLIATAATADSRDGLIAFDPVEQRVLWSARLPGGTIEIEAADLDADGIDDVVGIGNQLHHSLYVLSGADGGELRAPRALGGAPTDVEIGSLDRDGTADVVVTTEAGSVIVFNGRFGSVLWTYENDAGAARLQTVALSDLDGDGLDDVVVGGYGAPRSVTMGNGDNSTSIGTTVGPFVAALDGGSGRVLWDYADPGSGTTRSVALGDLDRDGVDDVVAHASFFETGHLVALDGRGRKVAEHALKEPRELWAFDTTRPGAGEQHVVSADGLSLADGDSDGIPDAYVPLWHGSLFAVSGKVPDQQEIGAKPPRARELWEEVRTGPNYSARLVERGESRSVLSLSGDHLIALRDAATGEPEWTFDAGGSPSLATGDFDGDGSRDVGIANTSGRAYALTGRGALLTSNDHFWPQKLIGVASIDTDGDGSDEFAGASADGVVRVIDPRSGGSLWETRLTAAATSLTSGHDLVVVGTGDGRVVALAGATGREIWTASNASGRAVSSIAFSAAAGSFAAGDEAGRLRILDSGGSSLGSGLGGGSIVDLTALDVDDDGIEEFAAAAGSAFALFGSRGALVWKAPAAHAYEVASGDLDGDGADDVVGAGYTGSAYGLNGASGLVLWTRSNGDPGGVGAVDIDGDGTEEAVLGSADSGRVRAIATDGSVVAGCILSKNPVEIAVADLDGDGFTEAIVSTEQGDIYLLGVTADRGGVVPPPRETKESPPPGPRGSYPANPNDPYFSSGHGLDPLGLAQYGEAEAGLQWGLQKIRANEAWQQARATGHGIDVAVLDTGVDAQHEDLDCADKIKIVPQSDPVSGDGDPSDEHGHGTHVAGIIGACTNNGTGISGVSPDVRIVPIRSLDAGGSGSVSQIASGIEAATDAGAHVINMSLSFGSSSGADLFDLSAIDSAIQGAAAEGVVLVAAAGNSGFPLCEYPSLVEDVICVGATDNRDHKSWYSTFANKIARGGPAVVAPGGAGTAFCDLDSEEILSLFPAALAPGNDCDERPAYENMSGTSMAAPHVAGVAALVYDRLGGHRSPQNGAKVIAAVTSTVVDLGPPGYDPVFGSGRIDALAAVKSIQIPDLRFTRDSATSGRHSDQSHVAAQLSKADGTPIAGAEVSFTVADDGGKRSFAATTDDSGVAFSDIEIEEPAGTYTLTAGFRGDETYAPNSVATEFTVTPDDSETALVVSGYGHDRRLTAMVTDRDAPETSIAGVPVTFTSDGGAIGEAVTDNAGIATLRPPPPHDKGARTYEASFEGDDFYLASSDEALTGEGLPRLFFAPDSATGGQYSDVAVVGVRLQDEGGDPIEGAHVTFELSGPGGSRTFSLRTDAAGSAQEVIVVREVPGAYTLTARYGGLTGQHTSAATSSDFVVSKEETALNLDISGKGATRALVARLSDADGPEVGISGRLLEFYADGKMLGIATTNDDGMATFDTPSRYQGGKHNFRAIFAGDDFYLRSLDAKRTRSQRQGD